MKTPFCLILKYKVNKSAIYFKVVPEFDIDKSLRVLWVQSRSFDGNAILNPEIRTVIQVGHNTYNRYLLFILHNRNETKC